MIEFSDVQKLVSFFKIFALRKGPLRETKKKGAVVHTPFWDRTNISGAITTILFRKQPIFTRESMEM